MTTFGAGDGPFRTDTFGDNQSSGDEGDEGSGPDAIYKLPAVLVSNFSPDEIALGTVELSRLLRNLFVKLKLDKLVADVKMITPCVARVAFNDVSGLKKFFKKSCKTGFVLPHTPSATHCNASQMLKVEVEVETHCQVALNPTILELLTDSPDVIQQLCVKSNLLLVEDGTTVQGFLTNLLEFYAGVQHTLRQRAAVTGGSNSLGNKQIVKSSDTQPDEAGTNPGGRQPLTQATTPSSSHGHAVVQPQHGRAATAPEPSQAACLPDRAAESRSTAGTAAKATPWNTPLRDSEDDGDGNGVSSAAAGLSSSSAPQTPSSYQPYSEGRAAATPQTHPAQPQSSIKSASIIYEDQIPGAEPLLRYLYRQYELDDVASRMGCMVKLDLQGYLTCLTVTSYDEDALERCVNSLVELRDKAWNKDQLHVCRVPTSMSPEQKDIIIAHVSEELAKVTADPAVTYVDQGTFFIIGGPEAVKQLAKSLLEEQTKLLETGKSGGSRLSSSNAKPVAKPAGKSNQYRCNSGAILSVIEGDITKQAVTAIVNGSDTRLSFAGGVAKAIAEAAGNGYVQRVRNALWQTKGRWELSVDGDVLTTDGGDMLCEYVIHTASPAATSSGGRHGRKAQLRKTITRCLQEATAMLKAESVALPAIGCGDGGMDLGECSLAILEAVDEFCSGAPFDNPLKEVRLVILGEDAAEIGRVALEKMGRRRNHNGPDAGGHHQASAIMRPVAQTCRDEPQTTDSTRDSEAGRTHPRRTAPTVAQPSAAAGVEEETCPVCDEAEGTVHLRKLKCGHLLCSDCAEGMRKVRQEKCPTCMVPFGQILGDQPDNATMNDRIIAAPLPGYHAHRTIEIIYNIPAGVQQDHHRNPGKPYSGTQRSAYLPDSPEGRECLKLLKKAFAAKLVFTIGFSPTRGVDDVVTWNDIHHKTSMAPGPYGYPDDGYLQRLKRELAKQGITSDSS